MYLYLVLLTMNPLYMGNPQIGTFTNSENSDEMPHHGGIFSVSTLFVKVKKIFRQKNAFFCVKL